jgi:hypothetical protein
MSVLACSPTRGGASVAGMLTRATDELEKLVPNVASTPTRGVTCWFGMLVVDVVVVSAESVFSWGEPRIKSA